MLWRSPEQQAIVNSNKKALDGACYLCKLKRADGVLYIPVDGWRIIRAENPYDLLAEKHDILFPLEHTANPDQCAMQRVMDWIQEFGVFLYDVIILNGTTSRSVPSHFHFHLINKKKT